MTTTELYSGYTAEGKPSSRVLRPPGGGSSNIFGGAEPSPQDQVRQEQQQQQQQSNQNANPPQQPAPGRENPTYDAREQYQKNKGRGEVPYASFGASGKSSKPSQFNNCDEESQKEADFRCYSVTAYRDAINQNAATRERARGQVAGTFNFMTHEETSPGNGPVQRAPPQQRQEQAPAPVRAVRGQPHNPNKAGVGVQGSPSQRKPSDIDEVQYNPITGEEYPADYNQGNEEEAGEEQGADNSTTSPSSEQPPSTPDQTDASPAEPPVRSKPTAVKVRQPPGGKSSGPLW